MPSGNARKKIGWLGLKGNPSPKKGKRACNWVGKWNKGLKPVAVVTNAQAADCLKTADFFDSPPFTEVTQGLVRNFVEAGLCFRLLGTSAPPPHLPDAPSPAGTVNISRVKGARESWE